MQDLWGRKSPRQTLVARLLHNWRTAAGHRTSLLHLHRLVRHEGAASLEHFKERFGVTDVVLSSPGTGTPVLVLYKRFDERKRRLLMMNANEPELSAEIRIVSLSDGEISMPNGLTAVHPCGRFIVVDGGQSLLAMDVTKKECVPISAVDSLNHDFFCCTDSKLVILGQVRYVAVFQIYSGIRLELPTFSPCFVSVTVRYRLFFTCPVSA